MKESIEALQIKPDGIYVDGTLGGGGHSYEICRHLSDKGRLIGIDQDAAAIEAAKERLGEFGDKVTIIRSNYCNMVKELKTAGSGKLPPNIQTRKTKHLTASANDAFATIRITARDCGEGACEEALSYLIEILEQPEFPRSYSIEFRGPEKIYLPIPGLPKKGVHQLFACAVRYPRLHVRMENYARLAMQEDEWYNNLSDESCAMPGTFAVFALGLEGPKWWRLVCDYLDRCDDEHSSLQEKFLHILFKQYGFTAQSLPVLVHGVQSMQNLKPAKEFRALIANEESLDALLEIKGHLEYYLPEESGNDKRALAYLWRDVLWAIWGTASENGGSKVIKTAPKELKEKYQQVFA